MMNVVKKSGVFLCMLLVAVLLASVYGMIHDQISYSVSAEYFTRFKFLQFGLGWGESSPRVGAAVVGVLATWWMGVLIYLPLGLLAFFLKTPVFMAKALMRVFLLVLFVTLVGGLGALAYAYWMIDEVAIQNYLHWVRPGVTDPVQFVRVGFMHNASYIAGGVGFMFGFIYMIVLIRRMNRT